MTDAVRTTPPASPARYAATAIVRRLRDDGHVALFAGGCVRDELLGRTPSDYDVATDARPERVRAIFPGTRLVGVAFGVVLVRQHGQTVEVATFRADGPYSDGRHPDAVRFADAEEDARRRDFTANALFLDPLDGQVIDHVGGRADVAARRLRAVGDPDARFAEDHLRLLRAVRFAAKLDFTIDPATTEAIRRHAASLTTISPERVGDELRRMLVPPTRAEAAAWLATFGLDDVILGTGRGDASALLRRLRTWDVGSGSIGVPLAVTAWVVGHAFADPLTAMGTWSAEAFVRQATRLGRDRLRLSNDELDAVAALLRAGRLLEAPPFTVASAKRFLSLPHAPDALRWLEAVVGDPPHEANRSKVVLSRLNDIRAAGDLAPPALVTGDDLVAAGYRPGPAFRRVLNAVYDAQLEGRLADRPAAMSLARSLFGGDASRDASPDGSPDGSRDAS